MCEHLMVTWNMQGCSLAINDLWDFVVHEKPSVVVLTEVKRAYTSVKRLGACCGMSPFATSVPVSTKRWRNPKTGEADESTNGGVNLLASHRLGKPKYVHTYPVQTKGVHSGGVVSYGPRVRVHSLRGVHSDGFGG
jgi:hypothetical protein